MFSMMLISLTGAWVQDLICPIYCTIPPETGYGPESPTYKEIIKRRRGRLQPAIIEDDGYFWQCYPFIRYVRTEISIVTPRWKPLEDILKNGKSTKPSSSMRPSRRIYD